MVRFFCSQGLFLSLSYPHPIQGHPIHIPIHYYVYSLTCILFDCCLHSPVGWSAFFSLRIYFYPRLIPIPIQGPSYSYSHSLLCIFITMYTLLIVTFIPLSNGPLFLLSGSISIPILSPSHTGPSYSYSHSYSFDYCLHSPVGWSAFFAPRIYFYHLPIPIPYGAILFIFPFITIYTHYHVYSFDCHLHSFVEWSAFFALRIYFYPCPIHYHVHSFDLLPSFPCWMVHYFFSHDLFLSPSHTGPSYPSSHSVASCVCI
jgi:hypothetical protein